MLNAAYDVKLLCVVELTCLLLSLTDCRGLSLEAQVRYQQHRDMLHCTMAYTAGLALFGGV